MVLIFSFQGDAVNLPEMTAFRASSRENFPLPKRIEADSVVFAQIGWLDVIREQNGKLVPAHGYTRSNFGFQPLPIPLLITTDAV